MTKLIADQLTGFGIDASEIQAEYEALKSAGPNQQTPPPVRCAAPLLGRRPDAFAVRAEGRWITLTSRSFTEITVKPVTTFSFGSAGLMASQTTPELRKDPIQAIPHRGLAESFASWPKPFASGPALLAVKTKV